MALELLAGPFVVTDRVTDTPLNGGNSPSLCIWLDPFGMVIKIGTDLYVVQMDGAAYPFGTNVNNDRDYGIRLVGAEEGGSTVAGRSYYNFFFGTFANLQLMYDIDRVTKTMNGRLLRSDHPTLGNSGSGTLARLQDRWIRAIAASVQSSTGGSFSTERSISGMSNSRFLSWSDNRNRVWIGGTSGYLVEYDYDNQIETSPVFRVPLAACAGLYYSAKHGVFVSIHSDGSTYLMNVWAKTPLPTVISAPAAVSGSVLQGRATAIRCRVTGSYGEPCSGEAVSWSVSGSGTLGVALSETDADGYALNTLTLPLSALTSTVTAEVVTP